MAESVIEWTEQTWNPIVGCAVVSPGCTNCYAMKMAARLERMGQDRYRGLTQPSKAGPVWTGEMRIVEEALTLPLRRRKPTTWFVNSMSDLFHESVPDAWIDRVFAVMALCPQHTFQVLTKRSARMRAYFAGETQHARRDFLEPSTRLGRIYHQAAELVFDGKVRGADGPTEPWGLTNNVAERPNVWLGVSAEDQRRADERVPDLLATPAAVRFVSAEPLLSAIDFTNLDNTGTCRAEQRHGISALWKTTLRPRLDWIIVGGESGPGARPMHPDWARQIRDACAAAGVAFHFKQWGAWLDERDATARHLAPGPEMFDRFGSPKGPKWHPYEASDRNGGAMIRVGKKAAGRLLDNVEHNGFPEVARG